MEPDPRQSLANAWPLIAIVLMVSGILVRTVPLESKRPIDADRVSFYHAGRQDVEARLWQDPFVAMQHVSPLGPMARCKEALADWAHHPSTLGESIAYKTDRSEVTVLPVMVSGGPYFEDAEGRQRSRYAVITALLNSGWRPSDEDKLGYVWTFQSCVNNHWERRVPELLPYEWFIHEDRPRRELMVLWVDEDAITRRPLIGMERIVKGLAQGHAPCPFFGGKDSPSLLLYDDDENLSEKLTTRCKPPSNTQQWQTQTSPRDTQQREVCLNRFGDQTQGQPPLHCIDEIRVIGPSTSSSLRGLVQDLAQQRDTTDPAWLRFYSSGATEPITDAYLQDLLYDFDPDSDVRELRERFEKRVIRLTTTDDRLRDALIQELGWRLVDATPFSGISLLNLYGRPPSDGTIVVISESDTTYARAFRELFRTAYPKDETLDDTSREGRFQVHPVHYLRGIDGALPARAGASVPSARPPGNQAATITDVGIGQPAVERADGQSQYDYLRRLAAYLVDLDRREKDAGRKGVRAVGVLGNDVYDKILVLDALRDRFPKAVFFAADLDARLLGREVIRSTRNLIVASAYGLTLNPGIQGAAPPFRDTYQTGLYFSTLVALAPAAQQPSPADLSRWFEAPQVFEIGRSRAVPLSKGAEEDCKLSNLESCGNIHALDEWVGFSFWPDHEHLIALLVVAVTGAVGLFLLFRPAGRVVIIRVIVVMVVTLIVGIVVRWVIWPDIISGEGEPFAWFEGISIWPTMGLEFLTLLVTIVLLVYGRRKLTKNIDSVANEFSLTRLSECPSATIPSGKSKRGLWSRISGRQKFDQAAVDSSGNATPACPWIDFLTQMQLWPTFPRVFMMTALFFVFGTALLNLDWPFSPHRGALSAWINHALLLILLAFMMGLLCTVLDVSQRTSRYFTHLGPDTPPMPRGGEPAGHGVWMRYPVGEETKRLWMRFRFAVRLAASVNCFIYLPFIPLLLALPTRSRVLEAWNIPLPLVVLLTVSILLAVRGAFSLRRAASDLKAQLLKELDGQMEALKLAQYSQWQQADATRALVAHTEHHDIPSGQANSGTWANSVSTDQENGGGSAPDNISPQTRAELLRQIIAEIHSVQEGPFRPFTQEPVVRAILIVSGWVGGLSTVEFLFLR
jgi:hypothetical protein